LNLIEKGIHPLKIASGFDKACDDVLVHLDSIREPTEKKTRESMIESAKVALSSKVVSKYK
jgi:T-complex protein 1 subunit epsilon